MSTGLVGWLILTREDVLRQVITCDIETVNLEFESNEEWKLGSKI